MKILLIIVSFFILFDSISYATIEMDQKVFFPDIPNGHTSYRFGRATAIDGDTAVIAAYNAGAVYVYQRLSANDNFEKVAKLTVNDALAGSRHGYDVDISGDRVIASNIDASCSDGDSCGAVYIYDKPLSGWADMNQTYKLVASDAQANDEFGTSIAVDGNIIVVGAAFEDEKANLSGAAYIFEKTGGTAWDSGQKVLPSSDGSLNYFGDSVAIDNATVVVGAHGRERRVYVYEKQSQWTQVSKLQGSRDFGISVAIYNNTILAGATSGKCADGSEGCGAAYIYEKPASGWVDNPIEPQFIKLNTTEITDYFGSDVALDDKNAIVSYCADSIQYCMIYLFEKPSQGWHMTQTDRDAALSDINQTDRFSLRTENWPGYDIGISDGTVIIGAPEEACQTDANEKCGSASFVNLKPETITPALLMYLLN
jgi:hypothetical protein